MKKTLKFTKKKLLNTSYLVICTEHDLHIPCETEEKAKQIALNHRSVVKSPHNIKIIEIVSKSKTLI